MNTKLLGNKGEQIATDYHFGKGYKILHRNFVAFGAEIDIEQNEAMAGKDGIISKADSRVKILSVTTDEELVIAQDTYSIVK